MRKKPYTTVGIKRVPCRRCGRPSKFQWQLCADRGEYRGLCFDCDVKLNEIALRFMRDRSWKRKIEWYKTPLVPDSDKQGSGT
jgi:hypothetical protein